MCFDWSDYFYWESAQSKSESVGKTWYEIGDYLINAINPHKHKLQLKVDSFLDTM